MSTNIRWIHVVASTLERADEAIRAAVDGLDEEQLRWRPDAEANPAGWIAWHVARVMDDHLAELGGVEQQWPAWRDRFEAPYDPASIGYRHSSEEVGAFRGDAASLLGYWGAVHEAGQRVLAGLDDEPERIVDERWDPPVTLEARLVSIIDEASEHAGQLGYLRGLLDRRSAASA